MGRAVSQSLKELLPSGVESGVLGELDFQLFPGDERTKSTLA
jgi:hypothetical protein